MTEERSFEQRGRHVPVLSQDVIRYLAVREGGTYLDCTIGLAGHASQIVRLLGTGGHLIGFDRDPKALELAGERLKAVSEELGDRMPKVTLIGEAFSRVGELVADRSLDGMLADFGVSSMQIDEAERGFSFQADGPLDMRQDTRQQVTAEQVVNEMDERDLANLIYEYGEERRSWRIARAIVRARPVTSTGQLARVVAGSAPTIKGERIHPATRTFQALRIHVNRELEEIKALLEAAPKVLKPSGRLVVISFHSLEDRIAKDAMRDNAAKGIWTVLTKKPVVAEDAETDRNPRARSAKLRAAEMGAGPEAEKAAKYQDPGSVVQRTGFKQVSTKTKVSRSKPAEASRKKKRLRD
jgi:16S rRNA (cytosine1402-N4)-methyltransferase